MAKDLAAPDLIVAVFGAGTMGRGIAQVCAQAGLTTLLFDSRDGAVKEAIAAIDKGLEGVVSKGRMTPDEKQGVLGRLRPIGSFDDAKAAGVVIEAIVEDLGRQARPVPRVGKAPRGRRGARHQHLLAVGHRDRRRLR